MSSTGVGHAKLRRKALLKRAEVFWPLPREGAVFGHEGSRPKIVKICVLPSGKYVTPTSLSGLGNSGPRTCKATTLPTELYPQPGELMFYKIK